MDKQCHVCILELSSVLISWLYPGHTFTDRLAGSTTDQISRMTPEMQFFRSPIRMHNGLATGFDVSTKDKMEKGPFSDMIDTVCYGQVRNATD